MEVSKLFVSGLLCGALAFSPAKVDGLVKGVVVTTAVVGVTYGAAKLGAELSGDEDAKNAVQKVENSGKNVLGSAWSFIKNLGSAAASIPGAIYNGIKKAVNGGDDVGSNNGIDLNKDFSAPGSSSVQSGGSGGVGNNKC